MTELPLEKITVQVLGKNVILDPGVMEFNENTIQLYLSREYAYIDYFGKQLEYAQKEFMYAEIEADKVYSRKFMESKDSGGSDNYAKAFALANDEVVVAKKLAADKKEIVGHIRSHLNALYKNHENVQNRGNTLRAEMRHLNRDFYETYEAPGS